MCVAILTKPGAIIPNNRLYAGWSRNQHGGGFAFVNEKGEVVIRKGFMGYNDFQREYAKSAEKYAEVSPFLVHMRISTSGGVIPANTHPFKIKGGAMIHNGVMFQPPVRPEYKNKSDTRIFAERMFNILTLEDVLKAEKRILSSVGQYNKLVFLYEDKQYAILNEEAGNWKDDIWYSNTDCTPFVAASSALTVVKKKE